MKAYPYPFLTLVLIALTFLFPCQVVAENIDAKLPDSDSTSSFQVKDSADNVLMKIQSGGNVGIGTDSPNSTLHVNGSFSVKYKSLSTSGSSSGATIIGVSTTSGITVTLSSADCVPGRIITIKNETDNSGTGLIVITPASGSIDGSSSYSIDNGYGFVQLYSNGTNWFVIAKSYAY